MEGWREGRMEEEREGEMTKTKENDLNSRMTRAGEPVNLKIK